MSNNAFVSWRVTLQPWEIERQILKSGVALPLNIRDNPNAKHTSYLQDVRGKAVRAALAAAIVSDNGGPRRASLILTP